MAERSTTTAAPAHTNRLARAKSPYLLQHAHNPVDWFPWGAEAFEKARREEKPIFLSIGYSTCHWCHVMERESFEAEEVGAYLSEHYVCIKVDREERPDIDRIYMTFVQATTGQGGWPLNVFLTPELKPFFGGTYFPPDNRYGRPGFSKLARHIHELWENRRADLAESAAAIHARLEQIATANQEPSNPAITAEMLRHAGATFKQTYDPVHGGFGGAPKFPQPSLPQFLLRYARRFQDEEAIRMVRHTCERMAAGGIHDQLGGGFARYSVDAEWLIPHFEKMLYDNAQLAQLYLDTFLATSQIKNQKSKIENLSSVVRDVLDYVLRDMTHPDGGFYSAEDADSEGHEGKFYCWTRAELEKLLDPEESAVAVRYFGITEHGNFQDHSHPHPLPNQNVLSVVDPNLSEAEQTLLVSAKNKMLLARNRRVRPHLDDKVLASWNGLTLGALARAAIVLGEDAYRRAAEQNLAFIRERLWVPAHVSAGTPGTGRAHSNSESRGAAHSVGTLYHRWRDGERDSVELLEAYAFLLSGVIELYECTLETKHLDFALALAEAMLAKFHDPEKGGFWQSPAGLNDLILRMKEDYDGAEPSGNSVAILALLKLGAITGRKDLTEAAEKGVRLLAGRMQQVPQAVTYLLQALDFSLQEPIRAVLAGDPGSPEGRNLLRVIHSVYQPNKVVLGNAGAVEDFSRTLPAKDGPVVYLCIGTSCQPPTSDAAELWRRISRADGHRTRS